MKMMLKPSRRPRFNPIMPEEFPSFFQAADSQEMFEMPTNVNTFYQSPLGQAVWAIKHMETRAQSMVYKKSMNMKKKMRVNSRLPSIKPMVQDYPPHIVSKVFSDHYRTQEMLSESSHRASHVVEASKETVQRC